MSAPTVLDLRRRTCFVCHTIAHFEQCQDGHPDGWVHPCKCILVAHQACAISMVDSLPGKGAQPRCPICRHPYEIEKTRYASLELLRLGNRLSLTAGKFLVYGAGGVLCLYAGERLFNIMRLWGTYSLKSVFGETIFDILLTDDVSNWSWSNRLFIPTLSLHALYTQPSLRHLLSCILCFPSEPPLRIRNQLVHNALRIDTGNPLVNTFTTPFDTFTPRWPPTPVQFGACIYLAHLAYDLVTIRALRLSSLLPGYTSMLLDVYSLSVVFRAWRRARNDGQDVRDQIQEVMVDDGVPAPLAAAAPAQPPPAAAPEPEPAQVNDEQENNIWCQLLFPLIARGMGEVLKRSAGYCHWRPAQQVLGIRSPMRSIAITLNTDMLSDVDYWERFTVWLWSEAVDPVWLRNTLGLGLFCITRDCVHAYHVRLKKNEIKSRRIRSRNFEGLDPRVLDLIHPVT
ncbi:hypothetical protein BDZ89DRAFT_1165621 [Hymenopellis radicata]|nr:hypothetical protein BDZ89DRAFT_1165621 [Hymenopellis radicata]